jgi:hypothetical protein
MVSDLPTSFKCLAGEGSAFKLPGWMLQGEWDAEAKVIKICKNLKLAK